MVRICVLNDTRSAMKKRQETGRSLRLPVNQEGQCVFAESVNKLFNMADESYEDFARGLQTEEGDDCGFAFGKVPITAVARISRAVDGEEKPISASLPMRLRPHSSNKRSRRPKCLFVAITDLDGGRP